MITNHTVRHQHPRDRRRASTASTRRSTLPGGQGFSFNQYLIVDDEPLLFHTGPRRMFPLVQRGDRAVMPVERLRYVGLLALRGRRVRRAERVPRRRAARRAGLQPGRGDGLGQRLRRPRAARARRRRGARARPAHAALVRHAARAARLGVRPADGHRRRARSSAATCSRRAAAARSRSPRPTSSGRARRSASRWTTSRTRRRRARRSSASRARQPTTLACMHGSAWRGDGARAAARARGGGRPAARARRLKTGHRTRRRSTTHASRGTPRHRPWGSAPHIPVRRRPGTHAPCCAAASRVMLG